MLKDTSKFKVHDYVYIKGDFVLSRGYWDGNSHLSLACRWEDPDGLGYPQTFGKPQWMLLPDDIDVEIVSTLRPADARVTITFRPGRELPPPQAASA